MLKFLKKFKKTIVAVVVVGLGALGVASPDARNAVGDAVGNLIGE